MAYINTKDIYKLFENGVANLHVSDIDVLPRADVMEVVRCKNCTHKVDYCGRIMCDKDARRINDGIVGLTFTSPEQFCSYGERKDGGDINEDSTQ